MASSILALYNPELCDIHCSFPYAESEDMGNSDAGYGDILPFFNNIYPPYFNLDPTPLDNDQVYDGLMPSAYREEEDAYYPGRFLGSNLRLEYYDGELLPWDGHESWQDSFLSLENDPADDNRLDGYCRETDEGLHQDIEQQSNSHFNGEETDIPYAYEPSLGYWSWLEKQWEEYNQEHNSWQEPRGSVNKLELSESIFGYWPCMSRDEQRMDYEYM